MTGRLPLTVEDLRGRRAARWIRESTAGQFDRYGPDAQRELQDRATARLGLGDTGLEWSAAHSGATVHRSPAMRAMLEAARAGAFDVLLVGYVARWQRNLRQTLNLLEDDLHPAGVAVWFCDEELLSSSERHWDQLVDEAKGADSWLRRHRRRVREGYAAKRATQADPGGRPPFGLRRDPGTKLIEPDPERLAAARRIFELAAERLTDRDVAAATGVPLHTIRGMLTSPLYVGRLRTGERAHWAPVVDPALWEEVQASRARRRTRDGRPGRRRDYALTMLHCAACGRHLIGDTGRYRHPEPCAAFTAGRREPRRRLRGQRKAMPGHSYRADEYEAIVRDILAAVSLGSDRIAAVVGEMRAPEPNRLALARIGRERDAAVARYRRDRDARALEATMAALDAQEAEARSGEPAPALEPAEVIAYLGDLPRLWDEAPKGRRGLSEALFERIDVLGLRRMHLEPTPSAIAAGLVEAFASASAGYGRGERI
ncbi:MAG: recombinase family protein [Chloroflexota bacterium]